MPEPDQTDAPADESYDDGSYDAAYLADIDRRRTRRIFAFGALVALAVLALSYAVVAAVDLHQPQRNYVDHAYITVTPPPMCSYDGDVGGWYPGDDYGGIYP